MLDEDPIFKKGLTAYNLIVNGIVTYEDWLKALRKYDDPQYDNYIDSDFMKNTAFGKKFLNYLETLGWTEIYPGYKFSKRSLDTNLESIKLINMKFRVSREED
jgi:hypothetical protein